MLSNVDSISNRSFLQLKEDTWKILVVSGKYLASARDKKLITIVKNERDKNTERLMHMNLVGTEISIRDKLAH